MANRFKVYVFLYFICSCLTKFVFAEPVGQCPLPAPGPACDAQSPPWIAATAGNPVNLLNGNQYLQHTDSYPLAGAPLLFITRHYNSLVHESGTLGAGWSLHWDIRLYPQRQKIRLGDGRQMGFQAQDLRALDDARGHYYALRLSAHTELWFNRQGYLTAWQEQDKGDLLIERHPPEHPVLAQKIRALQANGHQLLFHYQTDDDSVTPLLTSIQGPFGSIEYLYEAFAGPMAFHRLQAVHYPDGRRLLYHYEQPQFPQALTGVSLQFAPQQPAQRQQYWWYDAQGRAFYSARADGQRWVRIDFEPSDDALLMPAQAARLYRQVHSRQGIAEFEFAPGPVQWQLIASRGAPCPGCPPVPLRHEIDAQGQHLHWPQAHWQHHHDGERLLTLKDEPWPGLALHFTAAGRLQAWYSDLTGRTEWYSPRYGQLHINYGNGDEARLYQDERGLPRRVEFVSGARPAGGPTAPPIAVEFTGSGSTRWQLTHPHETRWWQLSGPRIRQHEARRHLPTSAGEIDWHYQERFEHDDKGRLRRHDLFEGGALLYDYDEQGLIRRIRWQPEKGAALTLIEHLGGGLWRHHNEIHQYQTRSLQTRQQLIFSPDRLLAFYRQEDLSAQEQTQWLWQAKNAAPAPAPSARVLWYDEQHRLIGLQTQQEEKPASAPTFWAWDEQGQHTAHSQHAVPLQLQRDASGLVHTATGGYLSRPRQLRYNSQRRLATVHEGSRLLAHYEHDAFGYRIYAHYPDQGHHFFIFRQQQLVAEWYGTDAELQSLTGSTRPHPIKRRYVHLGEQPIALIDYSGPSPQVHAIHGNLVGAPVMLTDARQNIVWQAEYHPLGAAVITHSELDFRLRYPGQYEDPATGWHDNLLRTYDPRAGHYLEPDPLGPMPGQQPLGYARQQPGRFIDPLGLLLFAFDGTRYDARVQSSIWQLVQGYEGEAYYQPGPGNPSYLDWDALTAWNARQIVRNQWQHLLNELLWQEPGQQLAINIIGFSRGAALARHFANQIMDATRGRWFFFEDEFGKQYQGCIAPHFMGLFDTVAQFGIMGSQNHLYDLSIAPEWAWVAHAVALNEYRQLYPLYAITPGERRVQAGFIGNHGTMGGGQSYVGTDTAQGDLHKVPLAWMVWQARGLELSFALEGLEQIDDPVVHDARPALLRSLRTDRHVQSTQQSAPQWLHPEIGQAVRTEVEAFIQRHEDWQTRRGHDVGQVDLQRYYDWLNRQHGWHPENPSAPHPAQGKEH